MVTGGLAAQVAAVLERGVGPSVVARGGAVRVVAVTQGVVTLEISGSPGATLPLRGRIEAAIRSAVPEVTAVRFAGPPVPAPAVPDRPGTELGQAAREILDAEVNPAVAAHRGHVSVQGAEGGWIRIQLEGGCQGCALAEVTLRQGIEPLLRSRLPGIVGVADVTDHEAGTEPYFSPEKR